MGCDQPLLRFRAIPVCFNPRTRMGCDFRHVVQIDFIQSFNPRTRMGCDESLLALGRGGAVSIHAPAWGATQLNNRNTEALKFQSTHPHGVRPTTSITIAIPINSFNPRTRMGCDQAHYDTMFLCVVSIHAPAWGATMCAYMHQEFEGFQSTHPHGVRLSQNAINQLSIQVSIHAPAWGATSVSLD